MSDFLEHTETRYEAALKAAFDDLANLHRRSETKSARHGDTSRELQLLDLIRALAANLADIRRSELRSPEQSRVGDVHDAVLRALKTERRPRWSAADVRAALERQGVGAPAKSVTNCLDYLVRRKRLRRISRGLYYDPEYGVGIITSDDLGGEPARYDFDD